MASGTMLRYRQLVLYVFDIAVKSTGNFPLPGKGHHPHWHGYKYDRWHLAAKVPFKLILLFELPLKSTSLLLL